MTNKEIVKAIFAGFPVTDGKVTYPEVIDYSINCGADGTFTNTAGCIDESRLYHSVPCDDLSCSVDLDKIRCRMPDWPCAFDAAAVKAAMQGKTPVMADSFHFAHMDKLSVTKMPGRPDERLRYVIHCVDEQGNGYSARAEHIVLDNGSHAKNRVEGAATNA